MTRSNMICHDALDMFILRAIMNLDARMIQDLSQSLLSKKDIRSDIREQDR